jgi:hypothetical protein
MHSPDNQKGVTVWTNDSVTIPSWATNIIVIVYNNLALPNLVPFQDMSQDPLEEDGSIPSPRDWIGTLPASTAELCGVRASELISYLKTILSTTTQLLISLLFERANI